MMTFLRELRFRLPITLIARLLILRDRLLPPPSTVFAADSPLPPATSLRIAASPRPLSAVLQLPAGPAVASLLLFHGIGERLVCWRQAQSLLAAHGIASLCFAYSGYPGSRGATTPANLRHNALVAYTALRQLVPHTSPP